MAKPDRNTHSIRFTSAAQHLTSVMFPSISAQNVTVQIGESRKLSLTTSSGNKPEAASFASPRCSEKGCVFPASSSQSGKCAYHERQVEEPVLFCSEQPSRLLLDPARLMPVDEDYDEGRKRDRRRLAKQWEEFQRDSGI